MKNALKYLSENCLSNPQLVDRLIISSFIYINKLNVKNNKLILSYLINLNEENHIILLGFIETIKATKEKFEFEDLIELFEFVISPSDRIVTGAVYTPSEIREYIVFQTFQRDDCLLEYAKVADIACGCGGFLFTAAKELKRKIGNSYENIFQNQIFGLDIQEYSVTRSKLLLTLLALSEGEDIDTFQFNLYQGDALAFKWEKHYSNFEGFEIIVGNPPYVCARNLEEDVRKNLQNWSVCSSGNTDLYIPFFQIGCENLAENGILGFITMNTFFKSLNGRALRGYFIKQKFKYRIIDFGTNQLFNSRLTYTCICLIEKSESKYIEYTKLNEVNLNNVNSFNFIPYDTLDSVKGWNLNNSELLNKIESVGKPFSETYMTRNGIATLKNKLYIFDPVDEDDDYYYLQNGDLYQIEKALCKNIINPNKFTRKKRATSIIEKVIFPYEFNSNKAELISENKFKKNYPRAFKYLTTKKHILAERDKGKGDYEKWFAFGRNQSLEKLKHKLFFPHITKDIPNYVINSDDELLFYNGIAVIGNSKEELTILMRLMRSNLFWYYIKNSSKPYSSGYYSLSKNYIRNFGIYNFTKEDKKFILKEKDQDELNKFFESKYGVYVPKNLD